MCLDTHPGVYSLALSSDLGRNAQGERDEQDGMEEGSPSPDILNWRPPTPPTSTHAHSYPLVFCPLPSRCFKTQIQAYYPS